MSIILAEMKENNLSYEDYINLFFSSHYQEIWDIAKKDVVNTEFDMNDLISELYVYLIENENKIKRLKKIKDKDRTLMRFCAQWCYNNIRLFNANSGLSNFKAKFQQKKDLPPPKQSEELNFDMEVDDDYTEDPDLQIYDYVIQHELNDQEKILYRLHITERMNVPKLKEHIGGNSSDYILYEAITQMKEKIKTKCNERRSRN